MTSARLEATRLFLVISSHSLLCTFCCYQWNVFWQLDVKICHFPLVATLCTDNLLRRVFQKLYSNIIILLDLHALNLKFSEKIAVLNNNNNNSRPALFCDVTQRRIPKECRSHLHRVGSFKSRIIILI